MTLTFASQGVQGASSGGVPFSLMVTKTFPNNQENMFPGYARWLEKRQFVLTCRSNMDVDLLLMNMGLLRKWNKPSWWHIACLKGTEILWWTQNKLRWCTINVSQLVQRHKGKGVKFLMCIMQKFLFLY